MVLTRHSWPWKKTQGPLKLTPILTCTIPAPSRGLPAAGYTTAEWPFSHSGSFKHRPCPKGYDIAWEGLSYEWSQSRQWSLYVFLIVLVFVYFVLACFSNEASLILSQWYYLWPGSPFGHLCSSSSMGLENNDIYAQIGLINAYWSPGKKCGTDRRVCGPKKTGRDSPSRSLLSKVQELRFRPIWWTSFCLYIAGFVPLILASGAGGYW